MNGACNCSAGYYGPQCTRRKCAHMARWLLLNDLCTEDITVLTSMHIFIFVKDGAGIMPHFCMSVPVYWTSYSINLVVELASSSCSGIAYI